MTEIELLKSIADKTNSDVTLFFIVGGVFVVLLIGALIPLYKAVLKERNTREDKFLDAIKSNTEVMTEVKTILIAVNTDMKDSLKRIHSRLDGIQKLIIEKGGKNDDN